MESKPFDGLTFCCTGITLIVRHDIATKITKLGGIHYSDLMSDVKYLIVGDRNTAKYKFCIKNRLDIEFINSDSVFDVYDYWLNGEDSTSERLLLKNYKLPIFHGLNICFSRIEIDSIQQFVTNWRKSLVLEGYFEFKNLLDIISTNGGKFSESLTLNNDCVVTTVASGRRYTKGVEWKKPIVHPIWIFDSIVRGGALDFDDYILSQSDYLKGCIWHDLVNKKLPPPPVQVKPQEVEKEKKRLRPDSSIWNSIMDKPIEAKKRKTKNSWDEDDEEEEENEIHKEKEEENVQLPQLFTGYNFLLLGFTDGDTGLLRKAVESNQGQISDSGDKSITHIILPSKSGANSSSMLRILPTNLKLGITNQEIKVYTEWWIERCIFYGKIVDDSWALPIKGLAPASKPFNVCLSGFTGIELLHLEKLLGYLNLTYCSILKSNRDLLVVNIKLYQDKLPKQLFRQHQDVLNCAINNQVSLISTTNKINACKKWQIPIVSIGYLWESLQLSTNQTQLIFADIINTNWCLFAPRKPTSLIEYIQSIKTNTSSPSSSLMKLPSPRKASQVKKYGRITGSAIKRTTVETKPEEEEENNFDITDELSQITYQETENNLLQLDKPGRRRMAAKKVVKYTR